MERWTEDEFRRVAHNTRISERTLEACRDVLVDGISGVAAAEKHKMFAPQISRALTTLRDKQAKIMENVSVAKDADQMQQYIATEVARSLVGKDFECILAKPGHAYEGPMIGQTSAYLIQKVGRQGVLHDLTRFVEPPPLKTNLRISYDMEGAFAHVGKPVVQQQVKGVGR